MVDVQALIEKVLSDDAFVKALIDDPVHTLTEVGVDPTPEVLDALDGLDVDAVRRLAASFDDENAAL